MVKDNKTEWVYVKKGFALPGKTEALGSIQQGDKVVKNANEEIKDNSTIKTK